MRFLARFGVVVLNSRALLVLGIRDPDVRYFLARLRYVEDGAFILKSVLLRAKESETCPLSMLSLSPNSDAQISLASIASLFVVFARQKSTPFSYKARSTGSFLGRFDPAGVDHVRQLNPTVQIIPPSKTIHSQSRYRRLVD